MNNKVCVVTGAAGGIGRGIAIKLAASGAKAVIVADIDEDGAGESVSLITAAGGTASAKATDVEDAGQIEDLMQYAVDTYGSLDVLVNNAAVHEMFSTDETSVDKIPVDLFEKIFRINYRSVFLATQAAVRHLRASKNDPNIINAASTGAFTGNANAATYGAMKAAIVQFTRGSAVDLSPEIRVNAFAPGVVDTPMVDRLLFGSVDAKGREELEESVTATHLIPRLGTPEDIANVVAFLGSTEAGWITGQTYIVDGGALAWRGSR